VVAAVLFVVTAGSSSSGAAAAASPTTRNGTGGQKTGEIGSAPDPSGIRGVVTAIDGKTLTVDGRPEPRARRGPDGKGGPATPDRSGARGERRPTVGYTVTATDATKIVEVPDGAVSDLAEGDLVVVLGKSSDGTVAAKRIVRTERELLAADRRAPQGRPEGMPNRARNGENHAAAKRGRRGPHGRPVIGTVTSVDGSTVTIRSAPGDTVKVTTTSGTTVEITRRIALSSIRVGDTVRAIGHVTGTSVAATTLVVGDGAPVGPCGRPGRPGPASPPPSGH
jgi:hypothetical protein